MRRVVRWEIELQRFLTERREMPFSWGSNDCATFAAEWVRRCTGEAVFESDYGDAAGAVRAMNGQILADLVSARLGPPLAGVELLRAGRGDVGLVPMGDRAGLGVVAGRYVASPGADGLVLIDRDRLITAWRI